MCNQTRSECFYDITLTYMVNNLAAGGFLEIVEPGGVIVVPLDGRLVKTLRLLELARQDGENRNLPAPYRGLLTNEQLAAMLDPDYQVNDDTIVAYLCRIRALIREKATAAGLPEPTVLTRGSKAGVRLLVPIRLNEVVQRVQLEGLEV